MVKKKVVEIRIQQAKGHKCSILSIKTKDHPGGGLENEGERRREG